ncbi:MAG: cytochrome c1 [Kiloniellales bacterium]|nr:cytochrome c1 [Kiloniellales bacterium]
MKSLARSAATAALGALCGVMLGAASVQAAEGIKLPKQDWSFDGLFGLFDRPQLQRGLQVYQEVCAGCHGLKYIAFRNLSDLGYTEDQIKAFASEAVIVDGPDDDGEMFEREGRPSDYFPAPFPNDKAAAAANNGAVPPELSLMAKARFGGPDYIYALLTGYEEPPADFEVLEGLSYNAYFPGHQIAMAPPLFDGAVEYADGTEATVDQMARDVSAFLMWAAEPTLEDRKTAGIWVLLFFLFVTGVTYASKKKIWADLHKEEGGKA